MQDAPSNVVRTPIEVRYAETDQMGIVHHANYVVWFEVARTRLCQVAGFHYAEIEKRGLLLTVTSAEISYRAPARYGEQVDVDCWVEHEGSRGVRFGYRVQRGEDLLATGATEHVWIDAATRRPTRFPEEMKAPFARFIPAEPLVRRRSRRSAP